MILSFCLSLSFASAAQVRKTLQEKYDRFEYLSFYEELEKSDQLSKDELVLGVEVAYELGRHEQCVSYIDQVNNLGELPERLKSIQKDIEQNTSRALVVDPRLKVRKLYGESGRDEFMSLIMDGQLLFSSNAAETKPVMNDVRTERPFLRIRKAGLNAGEVEGTKLLLKQRLNNLGPICRYNEGYILTQNYTGKSKQRNLRLVFLDSEFKEIGDFPYNHPKYSIGHATYHPESKKMVFASDMPKGNGETDLWVSTFDNETWTEPVRFGEDLNTSGNEMFPMILGDQLYFASNGRDGFGGLDIYKCDFNNPINPEHLPSPVNSRFDDFGFQWIEEDVKAVFNSNRGDGKHDDIYLLESGDVTFDCTRECANQSCVQFEVDGFDEVDPERYDFIWDMGDGTQLNGMFTAHCYKEIGTFDVKMSMVDLFTGERLENVMTKPIDIDSLSVNNPNFKITQAVVGQPMEMEDLGIFEEGVVAASIWEASSGEVSFDYLPRFVFKESGYVSVRRSIKLNEEDCCYQRFSQYIYVSPAKEEKDENSILANLSDDFGDGEYLVKVVFVNEKDQLAKDVQANLTSEEGKLLLDSLTNDTLMLRLNHHQSYSMMGANEVGEAIELLFSEGKTEQEFSFYRIELVESKDRFVVKVLDSNGNPIDGALLTSDGEQVQLGFSGNKAFDEKMSQLSASAKGYWPELVDADRLKNAENELVVTLEPMIVGKAFRLDNINFDLGKSNIRPDAARILDEVVKVLKQYPEMHIELSAHTDARGSDPSNLSLSDRRAKSSVKYLVNQGIEAERLIGKGYGEQVLLNDCKNGVRCSDKEHEENRRVEVKILKM